MRLKVVTTIGAMLVHVGSALAQSAYLDDRSTSQSLVRSLYNAIERGEYGRAWSYFEAQPASDVEAYAAGFADTESVEVLLGQPLEEGAAGSVYFQQPVVISSAQTDGSEAVFAGCYTIRMTNPAIETDDYEPMAIEGASLERVDVAFSDDALPTRCGDDSRDLPQTDSSMDSAARIFRETFSQRCFLAQEPDHEEPESHTIDFRYMHETSDDPMRTATIWKFPCNSGAYNRSHVYLMADDQDAIEPAYFTVPELDVRYVDDEVEAGIDSMTQIGWITRPELVNSDYDSQTQTIASAEKWRGVGDASAAGKWIFRYGAFTLVRYEVDASYDGEINPETVVNFEQSP